MSILTKHFKTWLWSSCEDGKTSDDDEPIVELHEEHKLTLEY